MTSTPASGTDGRSTARPDPAPTPPEAAPRPIVGVAVTTAVVTILALLWANHVQSPWKSQAQDWAIDTEQGVAGLLWIVGFVLLGVGVIFGVVGRRALSREPARTARTALILALVAVPMAAVFWTGLPIVLGAAAAFLGLDARARLGCTPVTAGIAVGLGLLVAAAALFFCVTG